MAARQQRELCDEQKLEEGDASEPSHHGSALTRSRGPKKSRITSSETPRPRRSGVSDRGNRIALWGSSDAATIGWYPGRATTKDACTGPERRLALAARRAGRDKLLLLVDDRQRLGRRL